jgi:RNA polymerase sigma factor (sigma-70 family)
MSDQTTIAFIRAGKTDKTLDSLYNFFPAVRKMILRNGGTKQDAEDIFQEALIVFCRRIKDPDFLLTSKPSTYLFSVCRFLWKDELKKRRRLVNDEPEFFAEPGETGESAIGEAMEKEKGARLAEKALEQLGQRCRELLILFYNRRLRLKEIARMMGYTSENTAKNQKYKCLEGAKNKLKELQQTAQTL